MLATNNANGNFLRERGREGGKGKEEVEKRKRERERKCINLCTFKLHGLWM